MYEGSSPNAAALPFKEFLWGWDWLSACGLRDFYGPKGSVVVV
jgi:hypothetical protein